MQIQIEKDVARELGAALRKIGESKAVMKFLNSYGNLRTKKAYCAHLNLYFRWFKEENGVSMFPDELVQDNLICDYEREEVDVDTRGRHTDWLRECFNGVVVTKASRSPRGWSGRRARRSSTKGT